MPTPSSRSIARVVLHVIESFGAGSAAALQEFVDATPEVEHHLLRAVRPGESLEQDTSTRFESIRELPEGHRARVLAVRRRAQALLPDVVHAHSTWAGAYVRLAIDRESGVRVVYSPHCFAFERRDIGAPARAVAAAGEWILSFRTDVIAACSPREQRLAARMRARFSPVLVPNTPRAQMSTGLEALSKRADVVALGRLGPQKDPAWFLESVRRIRHGRPDLRATWIGDGEPAFRRALEAAGITVTGWIGKDEVAAHLAGAGVYLHSARWEGFPLAVLEAQAAGIPVVARRIGAFEGMPESWLADDPGHAAELLDLALEDPRAVLGAWATALAGNTSAHQRATLLGLYGLAGAPAVVPRTPQPH